MPGQGKWAYSWFDGEQSMQLTIYKPKGHTVLAALEGPLNLAGVPPIEERLTELAGDEQVRLMVLDLAKVPLVGSVGIRLFITCSKELEKHGGVLALMNPIQFVREVLEISGVAGYLPLVESLEEAEALIEGS